jgi:SAM-dependent methyltransferase
MSLEQLGLLRRRELEMILTSIRKMAPEHARVLDIGAGVGWQAAVVKEAGYRVEAIDMPTSAYAGDRVFPIRDYDGRYIPFADSEFDVVYSSNVLEHVAHFEDFQHEIRRVLKPTGIAIHIVPSGTWRFWSNVAHYPYMIKQGVKRLLGKRRPPPGQEISSPPWRAKRGALSFLRRLLLPTRDGEFGNAWTEIYRFSRLRWHRDFVRAGWRIEQWQSNHLFYTSYYLMGTHLSISARGRVSRVLGGSCHFFLIRPQQTDASDR